VLDVAFIKVDAASENLKRTLSLPSASV
jgi:hypothetical protein